MNNIIKKRLIKLAENTDGYTDWIDKEVGEKWEAKEPISLNEWDSKASNLLTEDFVVDFILDMSWLEKKTADILTKEDLKDIADYAIRECSEEIFGLYCGYGIPVPKEREHDSLEELFPKTFSRVNSIDYKKAFEKANKIEQENNAW
jgi:hypothetical protein